MSTKSFYLDEMIQMLGASVDNIGDDDQLLEFTEDLANVLTKHFGGEVESVGLTDKDQDTLVSISANGEVPSDGGIFADFDKDVSVEEFMEDVEEEGE